MIRIVEKRDCCGCGACSQRCPTQCIAMLEDSEGFLYPQVDLELCNNCGLCEAVCPVIHPFSAQVTEPDSFVCVHQDGSVRDQSSSGGLFTALSEYILNDDGVVFGAKYQADWSVAHDYTETLVGLSAFRGSKYVQSDLQNSYKQAEFFLKDGRKVLYSGTPCQIAGLKHFLNKKYDSLWTVDFVCHSIPSPKVWQKYLSEIIEGQAGGSRIRSVTFRDRSSGWRQYGIKIIGNDGETLLSGSHKRNPYMKGFLQGLFVRPSCAACPARNFTSGSDLMLGDCWGLDKYHPELDDDKGASLAMLVTEKGRWLFNRSTENMQVTKIPYYEVEPNGLHRPITKSTVPHKNRNVFFNKFEKNSIGPLIVRCLWYEELKLNIIQKIKMILIRIFGKSFCIKLKKGVYE